MSVAGGVGFLLALAGTTAGRRGLRRAERALYAGAAALGVLVFFNFGDVRHAHDRSYAHHYDQLHYHLGAKGRKFLRFGFGAEDSGLFVNWAFSSLGLLS